MNKSFIRYVTSVLDEIQSRFRGCAMTFHSGESDKTYTIKAGLLPVWAMTGVGDNDTSVIRGPAIMKAGRLDSYGAAQQAAA